MLKHINICSGSKLSPHFLCPISEELIGKDFRNHQDQFLLCQWNYLHSLHHNGLEANNQIHSAVRQFILQVCGVSFKQRKFHHRELCLKFGQYIRQQG